MKRYEVSRIRNVALLAHGGAGKTSLAEALLFNAGAISRLGRVEEGNTTTDYDEDEIKRKVTITSALAFCEWRGYKINLVDTPGFANFLADAKICLRVMDSAAVLVSAVSGVKVHTERVWGFADEYNLPRLIFINKLDRERADFYRVLDDVRKNLTGHALPIQLPIGAEASFQGVVDLVGMKAFQHQNDASGRFIEAEIPADLRARADEYRAQLVEAVAEADDRLLEKYLEEGSLSEEEVRAGLRRALHEGGLVPVLCGSAYKNIGIQPLLDLIVEVLPSPLERPEVEGTNPKSATRERRKANEEAPLAAMVFKTVADPYAGKVTLFRVYSGILSSDSTVYNASKGARERIGQVLWLRGKNQSPTGSVGPGDMAAVVKLKETATGDTLCDEKAPILLDPPSFPAPIISFAVEPKAKGDEEKMSSALNRLQEEDPTLQVSRDPQTKEVIISGMGEVHLEVAVERLRRKFGVEVNMKTPRVPYKETIRGTASVQGKYKKQTGGRGQYGDCWIKLEPLPRGGGYEFVNQIVGGIIPKQYIPAVEKGILEAMMGGVLAGYPVIDLKVTLYDGSYHVVDSSELAFKIAGSLAFKKGVLGSNPVLLEPIMNVEVVAPDDCMGDLIGDLNSKRGRVLGVEARGKYQGIKAQVPLAEMLKYASELKSITGDRGEYTMDFSHYEEVPAHLQEKIIAESKKE
ncbi:MAG: elongation factor G [candidate division NC10 bacterium]|nr:elongation factor G [candidate division NC10 bacterium]